MRFTGFFALFLYPFILSASQEENRTLPNNPKMFTLTSEEMVFASKLSDENRHKFCYTFSPEERKEALVEAKNLSPNESIEKVGAKVLSS